jgi:hypothetical protein
MLTRSLTAGSFALIAAIFYVPNSFAAQGDVECPPQIPDCTVNVSEPGGGGTGGDSGGGGSGAGGAAACVYPGTKTQIPCSLPSYGWWSAADGCYYRLTSPQPGPDSLQWAGHYPEGAVYTGWCATPGGDPGSPYVLTDVWFGTAPAGMPPSPAEMARRAVDSMTLLGPQITMAPRLGSTGLVGLPVWMWATISQTRWGPNTATAAVPGISVTATATTSKVVWNMGDGHRVTCTSPGTAYTREKGGAMSPTCGYRYLHSSADQPGEAYQVTATATWLVRWAGGGQSGTITVTRASTAAVRIGELQVLIR